MGLFAGTRTSTALIDLLIWASKTNAREMQGFGSNKRDQILGWAIIMFNNPTATQKLANASRAGTRGRKPSRYSCLYRERI
jgi:hypothetical protein